jgi:hypothetical protein
MTLGQFQSADCRSCPAVRSAYCLNHDPTAMVEAGYGPATK